MFINSCSQAEWQIQIASNWADKPVIPVFDEPDDWVSTKNLKQIQADSVWTKHVNNDNATFEESKTQAPNKHVLHKRNDDNNDNATSAESNIQDANKHVRDKRKDLTRVLDMDSDSVSNEASSFESSSESDTHLLRKSETDYDFYDKRKQLKRILTPSPKYDCETQSDSNQNQNESHGFHVRKARPTSMDCSDVSPPEKSFVFQFVCFSNTQTMYPCTNHTYTYIWHRAKIKSQHGYGWHNVGLQ